MAVDIETQSLKKNKKIIETEKETETDNKDTRLHELW